MRYVDGFVLPVPEKNLKIYRTIAQKAGKVWREHGAVEYIEAVGDDLVVKFGVSFTKMMKPKPGETVIISFIVFKSRADRDRVNAKVMKDPRMKKMTFPFLSDPKADVIRRYDLLHAAAGIEGQDVSRPAEFLVDSSGIVRWVNLTENYWVRARPEQILEVASTLR